MAQAKRDENRVTTLLGVSTIDGRTPTLIYANPYSNAILTDSNSYLTKIDEPDSSTTYIGNAAISSSTASGVWQIKKISVSGTVTTISWAGGTDAFSNIWDNRASLSYS